MKRVQIIIGMLLLLLLAGNNALNGQRPMRGMMEDSVRMNRMRMGMRHDSTDTRFMRHGMGPMWWGPVWIGPMGRGMDHMWMSPMRRGICPMWWGPTGRAMDSSMMNRMGLARMGMNRYILENIPNLTERQKASIEDIRTKNQAEMKKFREETAAKMKSLRDEHRVKIMDQLTFEQKKWVESNFPKPEDK